MFRVPLRHPAAPVRTSLGIYRQAVALWWRGAAIHRHPGRTFPVDKMPGDQDQDGRPYPWKRS